MADVLIKNVTVQQIISVKIAQFLSVPMIVQTMESASRACVTVRTDIKAMIALSLYAPMTVRAMELVN